MTARVYPRRTGTIYGHVQRTGLSLPMQGDPSQSLHLPLGFSECFTEPQELQTNSERFPKAAEDADRGVGTAKQPSEKCNDRFYNERVADSSSAPMAGQPSASPSADTAAGPATAASPSSSGGHDWKLPLVLCGVGGEEGRLLFLPHGPSLSQIDTPAQFGVICKLTEGALDPLIQIIDKDIKQDWPQHRALGNTACDRPPTGGTESKWYEQEIHDDDETFETKSSIKTTSEEKQGKVEQEKYCVLQPPNDLGGPPVDLLQHVSAFLGIENPQLDVVSRCGLEHAFHWEKEAYRQVTKYTRSKRLLR
ncbi:hypothetical protein QYF61_018560 [Mycteria americana]|uniref:Uncharacterized protein n=1 Tax=Mycteria americana TaxID=33587 RepID=A0AAN7S8I4_MYCAM|nr:hypothetical protein QYF61_018560 [Mycteria americana]